MKPLTIYYTQQTFLIRAGHYLHDDETAVYLKDEADALFAEKDAHIADLAARFVQRERDISDDTRTIAMLEARIAELEPSDKWFGEVMAMLHGDGGHYVAKHGAEKAALDAVAKYHALLAERDKLAKACDAIKRLHMHSTENRISEAERLKEESRRLFADNIRLEAELDALLLVLNSKQMARVLKFIVNHGGRGLYGSLQDDVAWIEKHGSKE